MRADADHALPRETLLDYLGVATCKLVFRRWLTRSQDVGPDATGYEDLILRQRRANPLCYIDYAEPQPRVRTIGTVRAMKPMISPDGRFFVSNTAFQASQIFVAPLEPGAQMVGIGVGCEPKWWRDSHSGRLYVVYRSENGMFEWPHPGVTYRQEIDRRTGTPVGPPEVIAEHGFSGGLTTDGRYLVTGYRTLDVIDLSTGVHRVLVAGEQVCSVTTAPDSSHRVMQLRDPDSHDRLGIVNIDTEEEELYSSPANTVDMQTPKWSNHPEFATLVACEEDHRYAIYVLRLSDHDALRVLWGGSYIHPCLWCSPTPSDGGSQP